MCCCTRRSRRCYSIKIGTNHSQKIHCSEQQSYNQKEKITSTHQQQQRNEGKKVEKK